MANQEPSHSEGQRVEGRGGPRKISAQSQRETLRLVCEKELENAVVASRFLQKLRE